MIGIACLPRLVLAAAFAAVLAGLGGCSPRTPEVTREVIGLDASGRPVVSYTECDRYGLAGNLGGCFRETPPVVWCYQTLGDNDCYSQPDRFATREPEPIIDSPTLPILYALPPPAEPPTVPSGDTPPPAAEP